MIWGIWWTKTKNPAAHLSAQHRPSECPAVSWAEVGKPHSGPQRDHQAVHFSVRGEEWVQAHGLQQTTDLSPWKTRALPRSFYVLDGDSALVQLHCTLAKLTLQSHLTAGRNVATGVHVTYLLVSLQMTTWSHSSTELWQHLVQTCPSLRVDVSAPQTLTVQLTPPTSGILCAPDEHRGTHTRVSSQSGKQVWGGSHSP